MSNFLLSLLIYNYNHFFTFTKQHASLSLFLIVILQIVLNGIWVWSERATWSFGFVWDLFAHIDEKNMSLVPRMLRKITRPLGWIVGRIWGIVVRLWRLGAFLLWTRWRRHATGTPMLPTTGSTENFTPLLSAARQKRNKDISKSLSSASLDSTDSSVSSPRRYTTLAPAPLPHHSLFKLRILLFFIVIIFGVSISLFFNVLLLNVDRWLNTFCLMVDLVVWMYILGVLMLLGGNARDMHLPLSHKKSAPVKKARLTLLSILKLFYLRDLFHIVFGFTLINFVGFLFMFRFPIEVTSCLWHFIIFLGPIFFCFLMYDYGIVGWQYTEYLRVKKRKWFILGGGTLLCVALIRALTDAVVLRDISRWNREWTIIALIPSVGNFLLIHAVQRFGRGYVEQQQDVGGAVLVDTQKTK